MKLEFLRSGEKEFPAVSDPLAVVDLVIWFCKFKSLAPIRQFVNLQRLVIAGYPDSSFENLGALSSLRELRILHFPNVTDLAPLSDLQHLQSLSLESLPSWDSSGKRLRVASLAALARLPELTHLRLLGVVPSELTLCELEASRSLQTARLHGYPPAELNRFFASTGVRNAAASVAGA